MAWKTLKAIVELPVCGDCSEKDFRWAVEKAIGIRRLIEGTGLKANQTGRLTVKSYSKVMARKPSVSSDKRIVEQVNKNQ